MLGRMVKPQRLSTLADAQLQRRINNHLLLRRHSSGEGVQYQEAFVCYAYLADVAPVDVGFASTMMSSRWFTRGWTLQESIALARVEFYARDWSEIDTKRSIVKELSEKTSIPQEILLGEENPLH